MIVLITVILAFIWSALLIYYKNPIRDIFKVVTIGAIIVIIYSILTYGRTIIHSDMATANLLLESILKHKSLFPDSFNYANGDLWFLTLHLLCIIPSVFTNDQSLIRMLASAQLVILTMGAIWLLSKKIFKDDSWTLSIPIIFLFITGERSMLIYEAGYIAVVLWLSIIPMLYYYASMNRKKVSVAYIIILTSIVLASPIRYSAEIVMPLLLTTCVMEYLTNNGEFTKKNTIVFVSRVASLIVIPTALGASIYYWICSWHNVNNTVNNGTVFVSSVQDIWNNIAVAIFDIYDCFGYLGGADLVSLNGILNLTTLAVATLVCFIVPFLQIKKFHTESETVQYFTVFGVLHNFIITTVCVLFGQVNTPRYMLTVVVISIIISARYIYKYWLNDTIIGRLLTLAFCFCAVAEVAMLAYLSFDWKEKIQSQKSLAQFLEDEGLEKGYATYWNAYNNEVYSDMKIEFGAVNLVSGEISPFYWLVDSDVYEDDSKETFLMLTTAEKESLDFNIISTFGMPIEELNYGDYNILVFDHDISVNMIH